MTEHRTKLQKYSAPALEKGLDILEYLSLADTNPTLSQLAAGIGRSKNEIFRMMIVLEERGYIRRSDGDLFELTERLSRLGARRSDNSRLAEVASPYLSHLSEETGLSNHLSVLSEGSVLVIANTTASHSYGLTVQVGYRVPLLGTSAGACFLADIEATKMRAEALNRMDLTPDPSSFERYDRWATDCRDNGYVICPNPETNSIREISAPVRQSSTNTTVAVLTIPFISTDEMSNRLPTIISNLTEAVTSLAEKLAIMMPALGENELLAQNST